jgi:hypothetical protein
MRQRMALIGCAAVAAFVAGCHKTPEREIHVLPITAADIAKADAQHASLRNGAGLAPESPTADEVRISGGNGLARASDSLIATRDPSGQWRMEKVILYLDGQHYEVIRWSDGGAGARRIDQLVSDPTTIARSGAQAGDGPGECLDDQGGLLETRWHGVTQRVRLLCGVGGPAHDLIAAVYASMPQPPPTPNDPTSASPPHPPKAPMAAQ